MILAPCLSALYKPNPWLGEGLWKHEACGSAPEHLGDLGAWVSKPQFLN